MLVACTVAAGLAGCVNGSEDDPASAQPVVLLDTNTLSFMAVEAAADPPAQNVGLSNAGGGTLNWTATAGSPWITVTPPSGSGPATLAIGVDITGLDPGVYNGTVTVSDSAVTSPAAMVDVLLTVTEAPDAVPPAASKLLVTSFTLDKTAPANPLPLLTFSTAVNTSTLTTSNVTLVETIPSTSVSFTIGYDAARRQALLTPSSPLTAGTQYTLSVSTAVQDSGGGALDQDDFTAGNQPFTQTFDTAMPSVRLKGRVAMSGVGDVWMDGNFVYVAGRSTGSNGLYIVDATDLADPITAKVLGSVGFVQDVKAANGLLFATNEPSGGVRIFNVSNPYNPSQIAQINDTWVAAAHNVWVDGNTLYVASDTSGDIEVYDISTPSSPSHLASISQSGGTIHDMTVFNGICYGAFLNGGFRLSNVSTPSSPSMIATHTYTNEFTHSAWPSTNGNLLFTTDEYAGGLLRIWDISTPTAANQLTTYTANANLSIHNAQVDGNLVVISFYQAGLRILDVSTPASPKEIAWFDTFPAMDSGSGTYNGNWGVHKVGNRIAVSDLGRGLFLFRYTP